MMTRKEGFIDLNKILKDIGVDDTDINSIISDEKISIVTYNRWKIILSFVYENDVYFYKYNNMTIPYSELVAEELANDFGIDHVSYDLAVLNQYKGVLSKNFKKDNGNYILGEEILKDFFVDNQDIEVHNSLEDIWDAFEYRYQNYPNKEELIKLLMNDIINIYIYDIITCQSDRHSQNWGLIEDDNKVSIQPVFDNERILSTNGRQALVNLTIDEVGNSNLLFNLIEFMRISSVDYTELIKEKWWIISDQNLNSIFKRIEDKTGYPMSNDVKQYYLREYQYHRKRLERVLYGNLERGDKNEGKNR